jgi:hypothetical protein
MIGEHVVISPGILVCATDPCPPAKVGNVIRVRLNGARAEALGWAEADAQVMAVTPVLHAYVIVGPRGEVMVGGHRSPDRIRVLRP